jgi:type III secretion protein T
MDALPVAILEAAQVYMIAAALGLARMTGMIIIMPAFTRLGLTGILQAGVALALSLPLVPFIMATASPDALGFGQLAALLFKETVVGMAIGLILGVPLWAAEAAGEILDLQRGLTFAELADPSNTTQNNVTGTLFSILIVAMYFAGGGLPMTLRFVYDSYNLWPLTGFTPIFSAQAGGLFLDLLDDILRMGVLLVVPIIIAFLLVDLSLALVARAAPHMNIFVLSLTVKNLAFAVLIVLYAAFLLNYIGHDLRWFIDADRMIERLAPNKPAR